MNEYHFRRLGGQRTEPDHRSLADKHAYEVYSGNLNRPNLAGGLDPTPENITLRGGLTTEWSIMRAGRSPDLSSPNRPMPILGFSIEELSTLDFEDIPSKQE